MKSQEMHSAAVEIITDTMHKLVAVEEPPMIREVNLDVFL